MPRFNISSAADSSGAAYPQDDAVSFDDLPVWNLSDLYKSPDAAEVKADIATATDAAAVFNKRYKGRIAVLAASPEGGTELAGAIRAFEEIEDRLGRLISYAGLLYAQDNMNPAHAKFYGDMQERITTISTDLLFFTLELNRVEDATLSKALENPELAHYAPWLRDLRAMRPYQLSDELETLLHEKSVTGHAAWNRLFDETMARLTFDVGGKPLALEAALHRLSEKDPAKREKAAHALAKTFKANVPLFTLITNTLAKDKEIEDRLRGFEDVAQSRHIANRVEPEVVAALVEAVQRSYPELSHRYYAMKAKWLGLDQLEYWDRNAPLPQSDDNVIPWSEARETVLDAYRGFTPDMAEIAGRFFDRGWIDAPMRPGKATGAFAHPTVPSAHPYVLVNYQGRTRDVMTLAHELGHGVHQVLAAKQGPLMADTPLTLAEAASVFGEMLTFRKLLANAPDKERRKAMLASKVEDMLNTVVRQTAFYTFERRVHLARREGELTSEDIGRIWLDVQGESLGPAIRLGEGYETYWCYISHFIHAPFYVYAYAFGDCLVNSLYAVYENAQEGFAERYFEMLSAGGTLRHKELLAPFGLDASEPAFWDKGLSMIRGFIDELEAME
ncbi:M3 family oligoendopeptidase [Parvibaculum sp.]|uniref:M3 family oligoendopeptidase n=1 Tax=Parvibaculum sp. TaxID=2024848 RepID=UPI001B02C670|nr:M3 family oligoendopeptidase [Parvibaculum sp.]MBO6633481.1 M3 family oligoendopeptidase [Parvibaculum sp.]MBO6679423.1 M3 family oligoendopeptidase [Parvibaculum sp.]MBO6685026.1 M3 family oligoendopeptidase [Parvibaculum sp.]MBO6905107.1 M3 family oligoendopeptidase [Parvibaculum sp.]